MIERRRWLAQAAALCAGGAALRVATQARAHTAAGRVEPPAPVPSLGLQMSTGERRKVGDVLRGRITALQLMFTGCNATCPIQGAQFAQLQPLLGMGPLPAQLLSVSIDALGDDPQRMRRWLTRWTAGERWLGGVSLPGQTDAWLDFLQARSANPQDRHSAQVYVFDAQARLVLRSTELPRPQGIAQTLAELQRSRAG